jgi:oligoribonuclease
MLVWLDLETTGLDPNEGSILEIAMVATDDNFVELGEPFVSIVKPLHLCGFEVMDEYVRGMHGKSGLMRAIYGTDAPRGTPTTLPNLPRRSDVEHAAIEWCRTAWMHDASLRLRDWETSSFTEEVKKTPLAGNSVHFDKRWLIEHMSELEALFSHRIYDVSTLTIEAKHSAPEVYKRRPGLDSDGKPAPIHRALEDIQNSIETAKFYRGCTRWAVNSAP